MKKSIPILTLTSVALLLTTGIANADVVVRERVQSSTVDSPDGPETVERQTIETNRDGMTERRDVIESRDIGPVEREDMIMDEDDE